MAPGWLTERPVAHRGFHDAAAGRIENSLSAVTAAVERRFAVEVDLRITGDGKVVVFHDATLDRLCGVPGRVAEIPLAALRTHRLRDTADGIPGFDDLLQLVDGRVVLVLELKTDRASDGRLEKAVADALSRYRGPAAVMSFDPQCVGRMRTLLPSHPRGLIADRTEAKGDAANLSAMRRFALRHLLAFRNVRADFVAYDVKALPAPAPYLLRKLMGVPVLTWTVRTEANRATAKAYADQMIFEGFDPEA